MPNADDVAGFLSLAEPDDAPSSSRTGLAGRPNGLARRAWERVVEAGRSRDKISRTQVQSRRVASVGAFRYASAEMACEAMEAGWAQIEPGGRKGRGREGGGGGGDDKIQKEICGRNGKVEWERKPPTQVRTFGEKAGEAKRSLCRGPGTSRQCGKHART